MARLFSACVVRSCGLGFSLRQSLIDKLVESRAIEDFDEAYAVNLRAPFALTQHTLPAMVRAGFGSWTDNARRFCGGPMPSSTSSTASTLAQAQ